MSEEIKTPDLSGLPLVMAKDSHFLPWNGPYRLIRSAKIEGGPCFVFDENAIELKSFLNIKPYTEPTKRPMTHAEIFRAIRDGAVVRWVDDRHFASCNSWSTRNRIETHEICYSYTGTDSDVWQSMEITE